MKKTMHALSAKESLKYLESQASGLTEDQALFRLEKYGKNQLLKAKNYLAIKILINQFKSILVLILIFAVIISFFLGEKIDALAILAVIILNAVLGFIEEYRAEKSIDELKKIESLEAVVLRDGVEKIIDARLLVIGDILILNEGEKIPADCRILEALSLEVDESMLTGESSPVNKNAISLPEKLGLPDRRNMLYSSCLIVRGKARALVVAIGMQTEIGQIAEQIQNNKEELTPLQKTLDELGKRVALLSMALALPILFVALFKGEDLFETLIMGVSLAVSSIPEGLPIVVTVALALGVKRMVKMNVLTKKLPAIESLGGVDVICTDKTGTITKNKMEVVDSFVLGSSISELALLSVLSSDAKVDHGDPTEVALVNFLKKYPKQDQLTQDYVRTAEIPFSSENKYMAVAVQNLKGQTQAIIKGAPEVVLQFCKIKADDREKALQAFAVFAKQGLRVLAVISKELSDKKELSVLQGYTFNGLLAMHDPPREQVAASILKCYKAGVKVIMITGDHKDTAVSVAKAVGLQSDLVLTGQELDLLDKKELREVVQKCQIFARVSPQNKVQILQALQSLGLQVAMTGDGVNDAPALKKADIGIAVGSGTALSRDVADMVLLSDDFSNIVDGMQEGRHIFFNIKKFVKFLLSANFDEILCVATSILFSLPLSFLPIHVLWLNLVTDSFPALALSNDVAEKSLMDKKPYLAKEEIMKGVISYSIIAGFWGYLVTFSTFLFMLHVAGSSLDYARTMSFSAMVFFELFLVFSVRSEQSAFKIGFFSNKFLLGSVAFAFVLQLLAIYHPFFQSFLKTVSLSTSDLGWLLLWSSSGFTFMELLKKGKALYAQR